MRKNYFIAPGLFDSKMSQTNIIELVCKKYGLTIEEVKGKSRKTDIIQARQVAMYLIKKKLGYSYERIGKHCFGWPDHSTVIHAVRIVADAISIKNEQGLAAIEVMTRLT